MKAANDIGWADEAGLDEAPLSREWLVEGGVRVSPESFFKASCWLWSLSAAGAGVVDISRSDLAASVEATHTSFTIASYADMWE